MSVTVTPYFKPTSITGCRLWLDAQDNSVISLTSGYVSSVTDKALSTSFTSVGPTPANLTVASASINSFQSFYFNNSAGNYVGLSGNLAQLTTGTAIFVMKYISSQNGPWRGIFGWNDTSAVQSISFGTNLNGTGVAGPYVQNIGYNGSATATLTNNGLYIVTFTFTGTTTGVGYNGQISLTAGTVSSYSGSATSIGICNETNRTQMTAVYLGELIIYNTVLGTTDRQNVEAYLAQKWGLTSSLPSGHIGLLTKLYAGSSQAIQVTPYSSVSFAFAPTQITGCQLWLDGADPAGTGTAPANGATVSTWVDKSGNGKNAAATGSPTYLTGGGINFNGSPYFLNQTFSQNLSQRSIFIVMQETVHNNYFGVFPIIPSPSSASGGDGGEVTGLSIETTNGITFYGANGGYSPFMGNSTLLVKSIYNDNMNGTAGSGFLNGSSATTNTASYTAGTCSGYGIGGRWLSGAMNASYRLNGVIFEILYFNLPLGTTDRQKVESYLAQKWGIRTSLAAAHPGLTTTYFVNQLFLSRASRTIPIAAFKTTGSATGGTVSTANGYRIHSFTTVGSTNFVVTGALKLQVLVVGGGGAGASGYESGGGGAGGAVFNSGLLISAGTYSATVGNGGAGAVILPRGGQGASGTNSSFLTLTGNGGGGGGNYGDIGEGFTTRGTGGQAANGGCGGGGGGNGDGGVAGTAGSGNQGYGGGTSTNYGGSGGGGMGSAGSNATTAAGAAGGLGLTYQVGNQSYLVCGGGGGGSELGAAGGSGGSGIGGNGGVGNNTPNGTAPTNGTVNTGSGGGGSYGYTSQSHAGGNGGSGIVIIAYAYP